MIFIKNWSMALSTVQIELLLISFEQWTNIIILKIRLLFAQSSYSFHIPGVKQLVP